MSVVPLSQTSLVMRTNADFVQPLQRFSDTEGLVPMSLTGWSFIMQVKASPEDASPLLEADVTVTNAALGLLELRIPAAEIAAVFTERETRAVWDLQASLAGSKEVWMGGQVTVYRGVSG